MPPIHRRHVLGGIVALATGATAAACSSDDSPGGFEVGAVFPRGEPYVTAAVANRLPFVLAGSDGAPLDRIDGDVTFTVTSDRASVGDPIVVSPSGRGLKRAFLPLRWTPPKPGFYELTPRYRGRNLTPVAIQAFDAASVKIPQVGQALPIVATPTFDNHRAVEPVCSADPPCPLHLIDLEGQRSTGRAVAVLISTPAYCQTAICGPVLDLVIAAAGASPGIDVIHAEVYANPTAVKSIADATLSPIVTLYRLPFEPCLLVADRAGTIVRRLDAIFDSDEVAEAFSAVS